MTIRATHLAGDAADVEARAAERPAALDARDAQAQLRRLDRRDVAARSAADHDDVLFSFSGFSMVLFREITGARGLASA